MIIENQAGNYALAASPEAVCTEVMKRGSRESIWEVHRTLRMMRLTLILPRMPRKFTWAFLPIIPISINTTT